MSLFTVVVRHAEGVQPSSKELPLHLVLAGGVVPAVIAHTRVIIYAACGCVWLVETRLGKTHGCLFRESSRKVICDGVWYGL